MLIVDECVLEYPEFCTRYALRVPAGSLCGIVGPSGGGKTTLLNMVAGFETPKSGRLTFDGRDLLPLKPADRPVAMVFQDYNLFAHLTAEENVGLGLRPSLRLRPAERQAAEEALAAVDLAGFGRRRPGELSGGQRQRVAIARALVTRKPLLLLDEPFGALDPGLRKDMVRLVDDLRRRTGMTVLITIHTPEDLLGHADMLAFVANGEVIASGPPAEIVTTPDDPRIANFFGPIAR
jgi:thiamine transport system ATP-binding protein